MKPLDTLDEADREAVMKPIRDFLYSLDRGELIALGRDIGRCASTLTKIRNGSRSWPYASTLFPLARAAGLKLVFVPATKRTAAHVVVRTDTQAQTALH